MQYFNNCHISCLSRVVFPNTWLSCTCNSHRFSPLPYGTPRGLISLPLDEEKIIQKVPACMQHCIHTPLATASPCTTKGLAPTLPTYQITKFNRDLLSFRNNISTTFCFLIISLSNHLKTKRAE